MSFEPPPQYPQQPPGHGYPPPQPQQVWVPPPPVKPNRAGFVFAIVGGVLALCCGGLGLQALRDAPATTTSVTPSGAVQPAPAGKAAKQPEKAPADDDGSFNVPAGSTITYQDGDATVEAVMRSVKTFKRGCNSLGVDPENGLFVVVDVVVTQTAGKGSVNPLHFEFVADDGTSANALSAAFSGCDEPSLASADLRAGQKRAGKIAFDATGKAGSLEWTPGGLGGDTAGSWTIK